MQPAVHVSEKRLVLPRHLNMNTVIGYYRCTITRRKPARPRFIMGSQFEGQELSPQRVTEILSTSATLRVEATCLTF